MSEYVVMPKSDYVSACDTIREKTGSTEPIKSNELVEKTETVYQKGYEQGKSEGGTSEVADVDTVISVITRGSTTFASMFSDYINVTYSEVAKVIYKPSITSNATNFYNMFNNCHYLTSLPEMDTSNGTNFNRMFHNCMSLKMIPELDTSNGIKFSDMFRSCSALVTVSKIDVSKATDCARMFMGCSSLQNITFKGEIVVSIDFGDSPLLSSDSVDSIGNAVIDLTGQDSQTVTLNKAVIEGMSDEQKAVFTNKNWTIVSKG